MIPSARPCFLVTPASSRMTEKLGRDLTPGDKCCSCSPSEDRKSPAGAWGGMATHLSQYFFQLDHLVGIGLVRSIFTFPFESELYFSEKESMCAHQLCEHSSVKTGGTSNSCLVCPAVLCHPRETDAPTLLPGGSAANQKLISREERRQV